MLLYKDIASLQEYLKPFRNKVKIGFVPTMGALHRGHLSLIEASKNENDITVCSVFVNPKQFNNSEDLRRYPRDTGKDMQLLENSGCDILFLPSVEEIYGNKETVVNFRFGYLEEIMEGKYREGHFGGVGLVVSKLFNIVAPDSAYFGQKDLQQFILINHLVDELNFKVKLRCMPILREEDGLAMSSRNMRLSPESREEAIIFFKALKLADAEVRNGKTIKEVKDSVAAFFANQNKANLEYFEIVNAQSLRPLDDFIEKGNTALCIAGYIDGIRLIDNVII